ncbi:Uncharacterized protein RNJ44_00329 [Nakaseomyces bracarensis]|uniref:Calcineurin-like phosphoesterase domain-containing protein n=1 Tax=Nakaseomyces bracarensis TaxID=273131 RepID=A0ABR4NTX9_9SACH
MKLLEIVACVGVTTAFPTFFSLWKEPDLRGLQLGKINFLHTTDTHGWLGSHLTQEDFDADWGDFLSFVEIFQENHINGKNRDLLLVDTGDKRDGNGISDATSPVGLNSSQIFNEIDYDILTLGNHELYTPEGTCLEYYNTAISENFKDKYVSSNVEFIDDDNNAVPFGNKYIYIETKNTKTRILVLSFLFDFQRSNERAVVTPALEELDKKWIKRLSESYKMDRIDMVVVAGHIPPSDPDNELRQVHDKLRSYFPDVVIQYFGGHSHIRDFVRFDEKATCLQSGKFSETLGFLSVDDPNSNNVTFSRRYIDFNKRSFRYHSNAKSLRTKKGARLSKKIHKLRNELSLNDVIGYIPQSYYLSARPLDSPENIYNLLTNVILPNLVGNVTDDAVMGRLIMINTGSVRYDLHEGKFTRDTTYNVIPFPNEWKYLTLPYKVAKLIERVLNDGPIIYKFSSPEMLSYSSIRAANKGFKCPFIDDPDLSEGFTTIDDDGCEGDDTPHRSQKRYHVPNVVQTKINNVSDDSLVNFVFYEFMKGHVVNATNEIMTRFYGSNFKKITISDTKNYGGKSTKTLFNEWAHNNLNDSI